MVVPLSPGELAAKVDAIQRHQSQKDRPSAQARRARGCRCLRWLRETCLKKPMSLELHCAQRRGRAFSWAARRTAVAASGRLHTCLRPCLTHADVFKRPCWRRLATRRR